MFFACSIACTLFLLTLQSLRRVDLRPVIFDSTRLGGSMVAKNPLQDFWSKRGGGQLFDVGSLMVILRYALSLNTLLQTCSFIITWFHIVCR